MREGAAVSGSRLPVRQGARAGEPLLNVVPAPLARGDDWRVGVPTLVGKRFVLREPRLADAQSLFDELSAEQVSRFMSRPPSHAAGFERFILWLQAQRRLGRCLCYGVVPAGHDVPVGLVQVRQLEPGFGSAEWGFALGPRYWGTGLFKEVGPAVVDFVFRSVGAYRLEARSSTENQRANGALRRIGATTEGVLRQSLLGATRPMDQLLWSLHTDDWFRRVGDNRPYEMVDAEVDILSDSSASDPTGAAPQSWRAGLPTLVSEACTLRELDESDAPELVRHITDRDVCRFIPPGPATIGECEQFIGWTLRQREAGRLACFAIVPRGHQRAAGILQLRQLDPSFQTAEWGFVLGPAFWGTGTFCAGARLFLDFAFDTVGVRRLEARATSDNERGNGALKKVGAVQEGLLRRSFLLSGVYHDDSLWALLADDWRRRRV